MTADDRQGETVGGLDDLPEFLVHAIALEEDAAQRYDELADAMMVHNNTEVAELFRRMAGFSRLHARDVKDKASGHNLPDLAPWDLRWPNAEEPPETAAQDESHYRMTAWHAVRQALVSERQGYDYYRLVADRASEPRVATLAAEMAEEEAGHVRTLEEWLERLPEPPADWAEDDDPAGAPD